MIDWDELIRQCTQSTKERLIAEAERKKAETMALAMRRARRSNPLAR